MTKLNIACKSEDGTFYTEKVKSTPVAWHKDLTLFHHKKDNKYYLTEYESGSIVIIATTIRKLREDFDKAIKKYGILKIKKQARRIIKISKITANK